MVKTLPLFYLYTAKGISGSIRFQKLVFLGQKETELPEKYRFIPYKFGPYSHQLNQDIKYNIDRDFIKRNRVQNDAGNYRIEYSLTDLGYRSVKNSINGKSDSRVLNEISEIVSKYEDQQISDLLRYVYQSYKEYTDESTLDIERLFDESVASQFIQQDESQIGLFNHIEKLDEIDGELSGRDGNLTRKLLKVGSELRVSLERINDDTVSIYWKSEPSSFEVFAQAVNDDPTISKDAEGELRTLDQEITGPCGKILHAAKSEEPLFVAVESETGEYTISWEKGREGDIVTIYATAEQIDYKKLRDALTRYIVQTVRRSVPSSSSRLNTSDEMLSEAVRQTAKLAIS